MENFSLAAERLSPVFSQKRCIWPSPTADAGTLERIRLAYMNERKLYRNTCGLTGKPIISLYRPDSPYKNYSLPAWHSDAWDARSFGRAFDFNRPFFDQWNELMRDVPHMALLNPNFASLENAEYNNLLESGKNAYLNFSGAVIEDSHYTSDSFTLRDSLDIWWSAFLQRCYECSNSNNLYGCLYCTECYESRYLIHCENCTNCTHCAFCYGLTSQEYCIRNIKYSKEEYLAKLAEIPFARLGDLRAVFNQFTHKLPHPAMHGVQYENCTGNYIYRSKDVQNSFVVTDMEQCINTHECGRCKDIYNSSYTYDSQVVAESIMISNSSRAFASSFVFGSSYTYYSSEVIGAHHCFGCVGIKNLTHVILNLSYSQQEYETLTAKIAAHMQETGEWGQFFPAKFSPFGYNETLAQIFFPTTQEAALQEWFTWSNFEAPKPQVSKSIVASNLPNIKDVTDDILQCAIICEISGQPFRITESELKFYRTNSLPLPKRHPDQRHQDRMNCLNPNKLWKRSCDQCGTAIQTTYSPDRSEPIYCQKCWEQYLYQ